MSLKKNLSPRRLFLEFCLDVICYSATPCFWCLAKPFATCVRGVKNSAVVRRKINPFLSRHHVPHRSMGWFLMLSMHVMGACMCRWFMVHAHVSHPHSWSISSMTNGVELRNQRCSSQAQRDSMMRGGPYVTLMWPLKRSSHCWILPLSHVEYSLTVVSFQTCMLFSLTQKESYSVFTHRVRISGFCHQWRHGI